MKVTLIFLLTYLLILLSSLAQCNILDHVTGRVKSTPEEPLPEVMSALAEQYTPGCLKVALADVNGSEDSIRTHVRLDPDREEAASQAIRYINEETSRVTRRACVTYLANQLPNEEVFSAMTDLQSKYMTRYFVLDTHDMDAAQHVLMDQRLHNEEHVAVLVEQATHSGASWYVYTRQLLTPSGQPEVRLANKWTSERGFIINTELFPEQMGNFWGQKLQGVTLDFRPFTDYKKIPGSRVVIPQPSLDVYILNVIAENLNFTYELQMPEDGLWGFQKPDGHWVGVVGDVEFRKANFSLCLSVTEERKRSVEMTRVYYIDPLSFVTAKSRPQPQWKKLITPFSESVWALVFVSIFWGTMIYYVLASTQGLLDHRNITKSRIFLHTYGSFMSQSLVSRTLPWIRAGQVLLGFWFLYSFLITTYYKTSLTASLAVPSRPATIDTLTDLLNSDLSFGMIDAKGSEYQLFSRSEVKLYQQLFQKMTYYSSSDSMQRVSEGSYAYIYFKSNLESIVNTQFTRKNGETNLHIAMEEFFPGGYGWAFPKGAPYARKFDAVMWRCLQVGLIGKWLKDLNTIFLKEAQDNKTPEQKEIEILKEKEDNDNGRVVLSLGHLQGPFFALFLGWAAALIVLILEVLIKRFLHDESEAQRTN